MEIIQDPRAFQRATSAWRREGFRLATVLTMGALHEGHFRLIREARGLGDRLAVSIFLNPTQFGPHEDLETYPKTFQADVEACRCRGVDLVFAPSPEAMYPQGFRTWVHVEGLTDVLCGAYRPGHFRGVTTVVMKLLMLAQADVSAFGWKDAQQLLVLRRMVRDLNVPTELVGVETVRAPDGLAISSRNAYLTPSERAEAPRLYQGLQRAHRAFQHGEDDAGRLCAIVRDAIEACPRFKVQYVQACSMDTLELFERVEPGNTLLAAAAFLGETRLIDNVRL